MNINNVNFIADGQIHRFHVFGDSPGTKNGWYIKKPNGWAVYGTWKNENEKSYINEKGNSLTKNEIKIFKKELAQQKHFDRLKKDRAAEKLQKILDKSNFDYHPYLIKKGFADRREKVMNDTIIIPVFDISKNYKKLISAQYIFENGKKRFAKGCRTKGGLLFISSPNIETGKIYLCEGLATGLTITEAFPNENIAICFYANNIYYACEIFSKHFKKNKIIICADNDRNTVGNPGVTKAQEAALKFNMTIKVPDLTECTNSATDYNDIMIQLGIEEVRKQLS